MGKLMEDIAYTKWKDRYKKENSGNNILNAGLDEET